MSELGKLIDFLLRLDSENVYYYLACSRDAIKVVVPGPLTYYEIEFFASGNIEFQTFGPASEVESIEYEEMRNRLLSDLL